MPTNLVDSPVNTTFDQLLHIDDGPTAEEKTVYGGAGVPTALKLGTESVSVDNVRIDGSTISTIEPGSDLVLTSNGGSVQLVGVNITGGTFFGVTPTPAGVALLDDVDAAAQRTTLGLGTAATKNTGTSGNTVPLLDGNNIFSGTTVLNGKVGFGASPTSTVNRIQISDTITDGTAYSLYAQSNISDPSGSDSHTGFNFLAVPTASYGSSGAVVSVGASTTVQSTGTVSQTRNFSSGFTTTGGGSITNRYGYYDNGLVLTNGTVTNNYAFYASSGNIGATNNYGFYSNIPAAAGRWNFYANGTAENRFAGRTRFAAGFARIPTVSTAPDGSTITLTNATNHLLYNNSSTVATLTINLPTNDVIDGQEITITTRSAITALTIGAGGTPVYGAPTTLTAGGFATFIYSSAATAWFRKG